MKKLTREEADRIEVRPDARTSFANNIFINMKPGDIILLEPKDWKQKNRAPSTFLRRYERKSGKKFTSTKPLDGSGWIIERVK